MPSELACPMLRLVTLESLKPGPWTESVRFVVADSVPDVPVTVNALVAATAELLTVSVSTLVPLVDAGENAAVTPAGRPAIERFTVPAKP